MANIEDVIVDNKILIENNEYFYTVSFTELNARRNRHHTVSRSGKETKKGFVTLSIMGNKVKLDVSKLTSLWA